MGFKGWIAFVLLSFGTSAAAGPARECISRAEMEQIAGDFTQFRALAASGEFCLDDSPISNLLAGLMFMRKTQFSHSMPASADELFSGRFASNWYGYFTQRIDQFEIQTSCAKGVGAYVFFFRNTMYVCPLLLSASFTAMDRASVFMHEARHIDGYPHVTCTRGVRQGLKQACDDKISTGGSYAVSVETYAQMAAYGDQLHPALRAYARAAAIAYADEAFDTPVRVTRQGRFLAVGKDGRFYDLSFKNKTPQIAPLGAQAIPGHIVMRASYMILYPDDKTLPARYVFSHDEGEVPQQAGEVAEEYNAQTPAARAEILDTHIGGQWSARAYADRVRIACDPHSTAVNDISLSGDRAVSFLYPKGYARVSRSVVLSTSAGRFFEVGCRDSVTPYIVATALRFDPSFKRIYRSGGETLGLTFEGQLFRIDGGSSTMLSTPLDGKVDELVPNEIVEFLDAG